MSYLFAVVVSSSCSTDETVVAYSDKENETTTLVNANAAIHKEGAQTYVNRAEISMEAPNYVSKAEASTDHDANATLVNANSLSYSVSVLSHFSLVNGSNGRKGTVLSHFSLVRIVFFFVLACILLKY